MQIRRDQNQKVDSLACLANAPEDQLEGTVPIHYLSEPSIHAQKPSKIQVIQVNNVWVEPIIKYLKDGDLPEDRRQEKRIRYRATKYLLRNIVLYKRGSTYPYLRCDSDVERQYILNEIHEGICGNHLGGRVLLFKALRIRYYWPP